MATKPFPTGVDRFFAPYDPADPFRLVTWQHSHVVKARAGSAPLSDSDYFAHSAVGIRPDAQTQSEGIRCRVEGAEIGGYDRCGFWLGAAHPGANSVTATPPTIRFQIRAALACAGSAGGLSEVVFEKNIVLADWNDHGLLVQVDDVSCQQWEFWAFLDTNVNPGATEVVLDLVLTASRGAGFPSVRQGHLVP